MLKIKSVLKEKGWSKYRLAKEMNQRTGIAEQNVYDWINGKYVPNAKNFTLLCEVLECESKELMG